MAAGATVTGVAEVEVVAGEAATAMGVPEAVQERGGRVDEAVALLV